MKCYFFYNQNPDLKQRITAHGVVSSNNQKIHDFFSRLSTISGAGQALPSTDLPRVSATSYRVSKVALNKIESLKSLSECEKMIIWCCNFSGGVALIV